MARLQAAPPAPRRAGELQPGGAEMGTHAPSFAGLARFARSVIALDPAGAARLFALLVATTFVQGASLLLLLPLLALVGLDAGGAAGGAAAAVANAIGALGLPTTLPVVLGLFLAAVVGSAALTYALSTANARLHHQTAHALRERLAGELARMEFDAFVALAPGRVTHVLTVDAERAGGAAFFGVSAAASALVALVYLGLAFAVAPVLSLAVAASGGALLLLARKRLRGSRAEGGRVQAASRGLAEALNEWVQGMRLAKLTPGAGAPALQAQAAGITRAREAALQAQAGAAFAQSSLAAAFLAAVVLVAVDGLGVTGGTLLLLVFLFSRSVPRVTRVTNLLHQALQALPSFEAVEELREAARAAAEPEPADWTPRLERGVEVEGLAVARGGAEVLHGVALSIPAGCVVALVGPSGAGKTTLLDTVAGLLAPSGGKILVDGAPLTPERRAAWRARVGYLPQEPVVFQGTVRANLRWAAPEADEAAMREALALAGGAFADGAGLDRDVGPRGAALSGGERQRLALAMALVRRPLLLILDEPTSQLDPAWEAHVLATLRRLRGRTTVLLATHRAPPLEAADAVVRVEAGRAAPLREAFPTPRSGPRGWSA